eukprot:scaffold50837_cov24-Tisochrysis_lutea.AAC.3
MLTRANGLQSPRLTWAETWPHSARERRCRAGTASYVEARGTDLCWKASRSQNYRRRASESTRSLTGRCRPNETDGARDDVHPARWLTAASR